MSIKLIIYILFGALTLFLSGYLIHYVIQDRRYHEQRKKQINDEIDALPTKQYALGTKRLTKIWDDDLAKNVWCLEEYIIITYNKFYIDTEFTPFPYPVYGWKEIARGNENWYKKTKEHYKGLLLNENSSKL